MLKIAGVEDLESLASVLQHYANHSRRVILLIVKEDVRRSWHGAPYGVGELDANEWEKANYERRLVPAGGV